jgi:anti-sigma B factor antagonist
MIDSRILQTKNEGRVFIVLPTGDVGGMVSEQVSLEVDDVLAEMDELAAKEVVIDFTKVRFFGSCLLAAIQRIWRHLRPYGGKLVLCNVPDVGLEVLRVSRFDELWPIYESRQDAKSALSSQ